MASKRITTLVFLTAILVSASYLLLFYSSHFQAPLSRTTRLLTRDGHFSFHMGRLTPTLAARQSTIHFLFDRRIKEVKIFLDQRIYKRLVPTSYEVISLNNRHFKIRAREDMFDWIVRCVPQMPVKTLGVKVVIVPYFKLDFFLFQFVFLFSLVSLAGFFLLSIIKLIAPRISIGVDFRLSLFIFVLLCLISYLYAFYKFDSYFRLFKNLSIRFPNILFSNFFLAVFFSLLFLIFMKLKIKLIFLPFLMSLFYIITFLEYKLELCGDALSWISWIHSNIQSISFAEWLSLSWAKAMFQLFGPLFTQGGASSVLVLNGKIMGVLFAFALYGFLRAQTNFSHEQKVMFFILASVLTVNVFFLGYPEFAYYPLPFFLLTVLFSTRYVSSQGGRKNLILATVFLMVAGFFHGSAFSSLPALFILPFLKTSRERADEKKIIFVLREQGKILLAVLILFLLAFLLSSSLGYRFSSENARGGADHDFFVDFFPSGAGNVYGEIFLDISYLWERGLGIFLAVPLFFILLINQIPKWKTISSSDSILFLFGIPQVFLFLFFSFDLGFRDFDLKISLLTLINLLLIGIFLRVLNSQGKTLKNVFFIFIFALTSQFFLLLFCFGHFLTPQF